nr:chromosome segregation protein SMC [Feifania hominis]
MRLKNLEIQGFKSFPDKIVVTFGDGITAIVGPNGSGKSNIVDAIRWVMGEQSSKTLRGAKMEDVIFNGTSERKPTGYAEVTLVLDNSDGELQVEFAEVAITRRLYRSGESEYYINRSTVRLRDIHELLMNTGLGRDGYSVIGQGKISEILSQKSDERRQIFEEAAGISKYRYRKTESERKLANTEENLVRIRDILSELTDRVEPLRIQSEKARKYLDLREEKKQLEINVWLQNLDNTKDQLSKVMSDYQTVEGELHELEERLAGTDGEIAALMEEAAQANVQIETIQAEIRATQEQIAEKQSEIAVRKNDVEHSRERIARLHDTLEQRGRHLSEYDEQIAQRQASVRENEKKCAEIAGELEAMLAESGRYTEDVEGLSGEIERAQAQLVRLGDELTAAKVEHSSLLAQGESAAARAQTIEEELVKREELLQSRDAERKQSRAALRELEEQILSNENIISGYNRKFEVRAERLGQMQKDFERRESEIRAKQQRVELLSEMDRQLEGFTHSVRRVMQEAERGRLKNVHGTIASLIEVDDSCAVAVETALGAAMQNIVVDSEQDAKAAIGFLKAEKAGRATFLPLRSVRPAKLQEQGVEREAGFVGIADKLARYDAKYQSIFSNLLSRTVVMENIDAAIAAAKKYQYRFRIVTLDGQLLNVGGSLTGGSQAKNVGVLSRKNEIARLGEQIALEQEKCKGAREELKALEAETAALKAGLDGALAEQNVARENKLRAEGEYNQFAALVASMREEIESLEQESERLESEKKERAARIQTCETAAAELANRREQAELELERMLGNKQEAIEKKDAFFKAVSDKKVEISYLEKDRQAAQESIEDITRQRELFAAEIDSGAAEIEEFEAQILTLEQAVRAAETAIDTLHESIEKRQQSIEDCKRHREACEQKTTRIHQQTREENERRGRLIKEMTRLEGKKDAIEAENDNVVARLWDEYELTYTDACLLRTEIESMSKATRRISEIKSAIKALGNINVDAIEEYAAVKERYEFYTAQTEDLEKAKAELTKIIEELTGEMKRMFAEQFKLINAKFDEVFRELFGGGRAELILSDPSDVLESGIEIKVNPPGKIIKNLSALSGGEQAFVAIALYFAILAVKPASFCILDEIESALDDVNVVRYANYMRNFTDRTQFIVITHRRGTMEEADVLYGVTMQESGVSKMLTINVSDVGREYQ